MTAAPRPLAPVDSDAVAFRPIRGGNAFEDTVERVLSAIKLGLVAPGGRLPAERDLAGRLRVSRVTLREALRSLADAGWLEVRRGRHGGTFVLEEHPPPVRSGSTTAGLVEDVLALRQVVEVGAVELAASPPLPEDSSARLNEALAECAQAAPDLYRPADSKLHLVISGLAGSSSLLAVVADARMRVNDLLDEIPLLPRNIDHSNTQHAEIARAIQAGQPARARAAMEQHLAGTSALLRGFLT